MATPGLGAPTSPAISPHPGTQPYTGSPTRALGCPCCPPGRLGEEDKRCGDTSPGLQRPPRSRQRSCLSPCLLPWARSARGWPIGNGAAEGPVWGPAATCSAGRGRAGNVPRLRAGAAAPARLRGDHGGDIIAVSPLLRPMRGTGRRRRL